jgi:hypothetical protein
VDNASVSDLQEKQKKVLSDWVKTLFEERKSYPVLLVGRLAGEGTISKIKCRTLRRLHPVVLGLLEKEDDWKSAEQEGSFESMFGKSNRRHHEHAIE